MLHGNVFYEGSSTLKASNEHTWIRSSVLVIHALLFICSSGTLQRYLFAEKLATIRQYGDATRQRASPSILSRSVLVRFVSFCYVFQLSVSCRPVLFHSVPICCLSSPSIYATAARCSLSCGIQLLSPGGVDEILEGISSLVCRPHRLVLLPKTSFSLACRLGFVARIWSWKRGEKERDGKRA